MCASVQTPSTLPNMICSGFFLANHHHHRCTHFLPRQTPHPTLTAPSKQRWARGWTSCSAISAAAVKKCCFRRARASVNLSHHGRVSSSCQPASLAHDQSPSLTNTSHPHSPSQSNLCHTVHSTTHKTTELLPVFTTRQADAAARRDWSDS